VTITQWACGHGFKPSVVLSLLSGRTKGRRGEAYRAAVALGLRRGPRPGEIDPLRDQTAQPSKGPAAPQPKQQEEEAMT